MRRSAAVVVASIVALSIVALMACAGAATAGFGGPGPWITGNDTGGIIPYSAEVAGTYRRMAADYCARWGRLSHVTSVHRRYGDFISFVCIDKPWMIH